jgi:hypothetical protein
LGLHQYYFCPAKLHMNISIAFRKEKARPVDKRFTTFFKFPCTASLGEVRVSFKLRQLELEAKHCPRGEYVFLKYAFNILGDPGSQACYDALLKDPEASALFTYGGFGSLLVFWGNGGGTHRRFWLGKDYRSDRLDDRKRELRRLLAAVPTDAPLKIRGSGRGLRYRTVRAYL